MSIQGGNREAAYVAVDEASHRYPSCVWRFCYLSWNVKKPEGFVATDICKEKLALWRKVKFRAALWTLCLNTEGNILNVLQTSVKLLYVVSWSLITQIARSTETEKSFLPCNFPPIYYMDIAIKNMVSSRILSSLSAFDIILLPLTFSRNLPFKPAQCWGYQEFACFSVLFWWRLKRGKYVSNVENKVNLAINREKYIKKYFFYNDSTAM